MNINDLLSDYPNHLDNQEYVEPTWTVTTECPQCKEYWTREEYMKMPIGCLALTMCPKCSTGEDITMIRNSKEW